MDLIELIQQASNSFDEMVQTRHEEGSEKYGPFKFLDANTLEEAMFELADLANYARYTWIKLYLMNQKLDEVLAGQEIELPPAFISGKPTMETNAPEKGNQ